MVWRGEIYDRARGVSIFCRTMRRSSALAAALGAAALAGCLQPRAPTLPPAEFLVATADSTYWVRTAGDGVRVRGVPMTVAYYGGGFHEVYVADADRSFDDAIITGERVYTRDLTTGDSTLVFDDTAIALIARHHARAHPGARALTPEDADPADPVLAARGETDILGVRGEYLLLEHRLAVETPGVEQDDTIRAAVDMRTGRGLTRDAVRELALQPDTSMAWSVPREWRRRGYTVLARGSDSSVSLVLRDARGRVWPLVTLGERPRMYWLDAPAVDAPTRRALRRAFNEAAAYDEGVKYAASRPATATAAAAVRRGS